MVRSAERPQPWGPPVPMPAGVILRSFCDDDVPGLVDLINLCARADGSGLHMTAERLASRIRFLGAEVDRNLCLAIADQDHQLVGYAILHPKRGQTDDIVMMTGGVYPDHRGRGIGAVLFQWTLDRAADLKEKDPTHVDLSQYGNPAGLPELATEFGFAVARLFLMLLKPELNDLSAPTLPPGVAVRHFVKDQDEVPLNRAVNAAFAGNWGYTPPTDEAATRMYHSGYYAPENMLITEDAEGICGHCFVRFDPAGRNPDGGQHALIGTLGVVPRRRGHGLGRAMLLAGLERLHTIGARSVVLNVDASDTHGAVRLYHSVGFHVLTTDRAWRKTI